MIGDLIFGFLRAPFPTWTCSFCLLVSTVMLRSARLLDAKPWRGILIPRLDTSADVDFAPAQSFPCFDDFGLDAL
jgi:hypothetical protein